MGKELKTIQVSEETYELIKEQLQEEKKDYENLPYVILRTYSAGVHAGYLEKREGKEAILRGCRNIWYWDGACGLTQLAQDGTSAPNNCKFTVELDKKELTEVIEVLHCTDKAKKSIQGVKSWKK